MFFVYHNADFQRECRNQLVTVSERLLLSNLTNGKWVSTHANPCPKHRLISWPPGVLCALVERQLCRNRSSHMWSRSCVCMRDCMSFCVWVSLYTTLTRVSCHKLLKILVAYVSWPPYCFRFKFQITFKCLEMQGI